MVTANSCQTPSGQASPIGISGNDPNPHNESCFVANEAPGVLDVPHAILASGQLVTVCIETTRCVGTVDFEGFLAFADQHVEQGTLAEILLLTIRAQITAVDPGGSLAVEVLLHKDTPHEISLGFLGGADAFLTAWQDFELDVNVRNVKFPADPCPGDSTLPCGRTVEPRPNQITFRFTGNISPSMRIQMTVDWLMLEPKSAPGLAWHPALLVHGLDATSASMREGTAWANGLRDRDVAYDAVDITRKGSIANNGAELRTAVEDVKARLGVERVHMVGHSKGGVDARHYAKLFNDLEVLVMLAAPNGGSFIADSGVAVLGLSGAIGEYFGGSLEMTTVAMGIYNLRTARNPNTTYVTVAGDRDAPWANTLALLFGRNDEVVSVASAEILPYAQTWTYLSSTLLTHHIGLRFNTQVVDDVFAAHLAVLTSPLGAPGLPGRRTVNGTDNGHTFPTRRRAPVAGAAAAKSDAGTAVQRIMSAADVVSPGATRSHPAVVDAVGAAVFVVLGAQESVRVEILTPSGRRIDPTTSATDPSITYASTTDAGSLSYAGYQVEAPETGAWTVRVTGADALSPDGSPYALSVLARLTADAGVVLTTRLGQDLLSRGGVATILAAIEENGAPVIGAVVRAVVVHPDGTTKTEIALRDDGSNGDAAAGDGEYTGVFTDTLVAGQYGIAISAERATPAFTRVDLLLLTVATSATTFSGTIADRGVDTGGDGLYDQLVFDVGLTVDVVASYRVVGTLTAGAGAIVAQARVEQELQTGAQTVSLSFDAALLFALGYDGPYLLDDVVLEDVATATFLGRSPSYATRAYSHTEFQRPLCILTGRTSDRGVNAVHMEHLPYEELVVGIEVDLLVGANVQASAKLYAEDGRFIAASGATAALPAGQSTLEFRFTARQVFAGGKSGPYTLRLLSMWGTTSVPPSNAPDVVPVSLRAPGVVATTAPYALGDFAESPRYTIGGTVSGLVGTGMTLELSATGPSPPSLVTLRPANGPFTFIVPKLVTGNPYEVRVKTQPASPAQVCRVVNGTGVVGAANVVDVAVICDPPAPSRETDP